MSAAELIEQIKALPPSEREIVRHFLNEVVASGEAVKHGEDDQFNEAAARVFEKHDELLRRLAQ